MTLPASTTNLGRALRAMHGAGSMTAGAIRRKANMHPDTEITARIRDIRKLGCIVACYNIPQGDGPRYKALGNSMAVPCMKWIGERIQAVQEITEAQA